MAEFQRQKLEVLAWSLSSARWVDPRPLPESSGLKRKREWSESLQEETEEETAAKAEDSWAVEWLCGLRMKLKKQRASTVLPEHHEVFTTLLGRKSPRQHPPSYSFFFG